MRSSSHKLLKMLNKKNIPFIIAGLIVLAFAIVLFNKFVFNKNIQLKRAVTGNINVLILGRGGGVHDGPDLTDTLIFAMFNPNKKTADLISIPRDLWVPQIKGRVNLAYAQGEKNNKQGLLLSKAALERVLGQKIDYVVVIDFSGFVKLIDHLGGVDVDVASALDDYRYPVEGKEQELCGHPEEEVKEFVATGPAELELWNYFDCRYKHIHVDKGVQHMNGQQALEFSRSRHGVGAEGSDFARSRRQQEVITAVRNKLLSLGIILNPVKVLGIYNILSDNIDTNIKTEEIDDFINLARNMQESKIESYVLDFGNQADGRDGLLKEALPEASKGYSYNLIPRVGDGNFAEIHDYVGCIAGGHICEISDEGIIKDPKPSPR
jgi:polyisoprenyl-teichoic acid--peptidoglycan teichoic acid transferase